MDAKGRARVWAAGAAALGAFSDIDFSCLALSVKGSAMETLLFLPIEVGVMLDVAAAGIAFPLLAVMPGASVAALVLALISDCLVRFWSF